MTHDMVERDPTRVLGAISDRSAPSRIDELRRALDGIDGEIVRILAQRLAMVSEIASAKDVDSLRIRDLERERHVLVQAEMMAARLGVSRDLVRSVFTAILEDSVAFQTRLIGSPGLDERPPRPVAPPS
jgi:isochorismate pyruvate lyase